MEAESKEQVLQTLGQAATTLRREAGRVAGSIQKFDAPIEEATTSSLEALKAYSQDGKFRAGKITTALSFISVRSSWIPISPAYVALAAHHTSGRPRLAAEHAQKAFDLRERVSEREKLRISAFYYTW